MNQNVQKTFLSNHVIHIPKRQFNSVIYAIRDDQLCSAHPCAKAERCCNKQLKKWTSREVFMALILTQGRFNGGTVKNTGGQRAKEDLRTRFYILIYREEKINIIVQLL